MGETIRSGMMKQEWRFLPVAGAVLTILVVVPLEARSDTGHVLTPQSGEMVRRLFDNLKPPWIHRDIQIGPQQIRAELCDGSNPEAACINLVMTHSADGCQLELDGPWCIKVAPDSCRVVDCQGLFQVLRESARSLLAEDGSPWIPIQHGKDSKDDNNLPQIPGDMILFLVLLTVGAILFAFAVFVVSLVRFRAKSGSFLSRRTTAVVSVLLIMLLTSFVGDFAYRKTAVITGPGTPPDTFVLLALGGSTMIGEPYAPDLSIPRLVAGMFDKRLDERPVVITNLAGAGHSIYPQSVLFQRLMESTDGAVHGAVLVYSGHNEGNLKNRSPSTIQSMELVLTSRSALLRDLLYWLRLNKFLERPRTLAHFDHYLRQVVDTAIQHGMHPVISTVVSNVSGIEPNWDTQGNDPLAFEIVREGMEMEDKGEFHQAATFYVTRMADDPGIGSLLAYRAGRCFERAGNHDSAREYYWTAVDLDSRTNFGRATRIQNLVIRGIAEENGIPLVDAVAVFEESASNGLAGNLLFSDGHHPNLAGYILLSEAFAEEVGRIFSQAPSRFASGREVLAKTGLDDPEKVMRSHIRSASWLLSTSFDHPAPWDRLVLAEQHLETVIDLDPDSFSGWLGLGIIQGTRNGGLLKSKPDRKRMEGWNLWYSSRFCIPEADVSFLSLRLRTLGIEGEVTANLDRLTSGPYDWNCH